MSVAFPPEQTKIEAPESPFDAMFADDDAGLCDPSDLFNDEAESLMVDYIDFEAELEDQMEGRLDEEFWASGRW